jgi:hypothetical protein
MSATPKTRRITSGTPHDTTEPAAMAAASSNIVPRRTVQSATERAMNAS